MQKGVHFTSPARCARFVGRMSSIGYEDGIQSGDLPAAADDMLVCDRCGSFALLCWSWGKRLCPDCRARAYPALATPPTLRNLIAEGLRLLPALGLRGVAVALVPLPFTLAL